MPRGATTELTVEGLNLAKASAVFFSEPGIKARILRIKELPDASDVRLGSNGGISTVDLGPLPPRNEVTLELDISPDADIGPVDFRLQTPLGTSPERALPDRALLRRERRPRAERYARRSRGSLHAGDSGGRHFQARRCGLLQGHRAVRASNWYSKTARPCWAPLCSRW